MNDTYVSDEESETEQEDKIASATSKLKQFFFNR
jgi:hypothetical protein